MALFPLCPYGRSECHDVSLTYVGSRSINTIWLLQISMQWFDMVDRFVSYVDPRSSFFYNPHEDCTLLWSGSLWVPMTSRAIRAGALVPGRATQVRQIPDEAIHTLSFLSFHWYPSISFGVFPVFFLSFLVLYFVVHRVSLDTQPSVSNLPWLSMGRVPHVQ